MNATRNYDKIRILGSDFRLLTSTITRSEIERAGSSMLDAMERTARLEIEIATTYGYRKAAAAMGETLKQIRAQRAINDAHASIANGLICGMV